MKFGEVLLIDTSFRPDPGYFSKPRGGPIRRFFDEPDRYRVGQWHYCRDVFHSQLYRLNLFFFSHATAKGRNIAAFMSKIEKDLNVYPLSQFGPTQRKTIMWIKPSRWWTGKSMRRSLFTILLRSGSHYSVSKDNFDQALFCSQPDGTKTPYALHTEYAVRRFLEGNTVYTGRKQGWYKQFYECRPSKELIDTLLVKEK